MKLLLLIFEKEREIDYRSFESEESSCDASTPPSSMPDFPNQTE
jgi:hypothetical protein